MQVDLFQSIKLDALKTLNYWWC